VRQIQYFLRRVFAEILVKFCWLFFEESLGLEGRPRNTVVGVVGKRLQDAERDLGAVRGILRTSSGGPNNKTLFAMYFATRRLLVESHFAKRRFVVTHRL